MDSFNEYQEFTGETAVYPDDDAIGYLALGLNGEAGELAESVKKFKRGDGDEDYIENVHAELGDVLWYLARLSDELGYDFQFIAEYNAEKLTRRQESGVIHDHNKSDPRSEPDQTINTESDD